MADAGANQYTFHLEATSEEGGSGEESGARRGNRALEKKCVCVCVCVCVCLCVCAHTCACMGQG